jgi:putative transposase
MEAKFRDIPDSLWKLVTPLVPVPKRRTLRGRPRLPDRQVLAGIVYLLRTGCQWKALPQDFGSGSACHARFKAWCEAGVFTAVFSALLEFYDRRRGIQWAWSSLDSAMAKAPKGGDLTGPNPTDRAKSGVKRHILTDGRGVPLAAEISGANVHDKWFVAQTLDAVVVRAPRGPRRPKHLCLDKGYDYKDAEAAVRVRRIIPHIRRRGEPPLLGCVRGKPRRWVVERTNSWHNRFRGVLIRWERIGRHYRALLHLACGLIAFQQAR